MFPLLFAQMRPWGLSLGELAKYAIIIAAVVAIVIIALRAFGVPFPEWAKQMLIVVLVAFVALVALGLVLSM